MPMFRVHLQVSAVVPVEADSPEAAAEIIRGHRPVMGGYSLCDLAVETETLGPVEEARLDVHDGRHEMHVELRDGRLCASLTNAKMIA
jgi:hypothetical protein